MAVLMFCIPGAGQFVDISWSEPDDHLPLLVAHTATGTRKKKVSEVR